MKKTLVLLLFTCCLATTVLLGSPARSNLGGNKAMQSGNNWQDVVSFIRITPTTTARHYSPFNTGVTFSAADNWRIEAVFRYHGEPIGSWGTVFGNTGLNHSDGFQIRQNRETQGFYVYMPFMDIGGKQILNTNNYGCDGTFKLFVVDTTISGRYMITYGDTTIAWNGYEYNPESWAVETVPLYIGEGPYGYGATIGTDWARVTIWKNGECIRDYVPHWSGGFLDLVSDSLLAKDARSSTAVEYKEEAGSLELELEEESTYAE